MTDLDPAISTKLATLKQTLRQVGPLAVALSGGTDSTLLLKLAVDALPEGVVALTAVSDTIPPEELELARQLAGQIGAEHVLLETSELDDPRFLENTPQRCYFCRHIVYETLVQYAHSHGYAIVVDGSNADDSLDYRPGLQAAREYGIRSPLQEVGLSKAEIRAAARWLQLPNWDKPAAPCLATRIPYRTSITRDALRQVHQAERLLKELGFQQVRVRSHGQLARIEVPPQQLSGALAQRESVVAALKAVGYVYVTLDMQGFRSGSMNETVKGYGRQ